MSACMTTTPRTPSVQNPPRSAARRRLGAGGVLVIAALAACAPQERVVNYKPFFTGIGEAQTATPPAPGPNQRGIDATTAPGDSLVVTEADGSRRLVARSGAHLIRHIERALSDEKLAGLFVDQVLCEETRGEYRDRGLDPAEAYRALKAREQDVRKLFARMPAGERSPFVVVTPLGDREKRVRLTGDAAKGLAWTGFDMVLEGARWAPVVRDGKPVVRDGKTVMRFEPSNWRLRWFVE